MAVPTPVHADVGVQALDRGKAVLMEKPLAASLADADRLIRSAERAGVPRRITVASIVYEQAMAQRFLPGISRHLTGEELLMPSLPTWWLGESAALARVQVTDGTPDSDASLVPLITQQRAQLELGRTEKGFDRELERAWLDAVEKAEVAAADVPLARAWLLGTLPQTSDLPRSWGF